MTIALTLSGIWTLNIKTNKHCPLDHQGPCAEYISDCYCLALLSINDTTDSVLSHMVAKVTILGLLGGYGTQVQVLHQGPGTLNLSGKCPLGKFEVCFNDTVLTFYAMCAILCLMSAML